MKFKLKYWYRGKVTLVDVSGVPHARSVLSTVKATGAVVLYCNTGGINAGKWFNYQTLK